MREWLKEDSYCLYRWEIWCCSKLDHILGVFKGNPLNSESVNMNRGICSQCISCNHQREESKGRYFVLAKDSLLIRVNKMLQVEVQKHHKMKQCDVQVIFTPVSQENSWTSVRKPTQDYIQGNPCNNRRLLVEKLICEWKRDINPSIAITMRLFTQLVYGSDSFNKKRSYI